MTTDISNRAISLARLMDRLPDGSYVLCVRKSHANHVWQLRVLTLEGHTLHRKRLTAIKK